MNYQEAIDFLYNQFPEYQKIGTHAYNAGLDGIKSFVDYLNNPQKTYKTIHVAGTNGKGSVAHSLASILQSANYKVGLYTSPHLLNYTERIRVDGHEIDEKFVTDFVNKHYKYLQENHLSFFEVTTALAFEYFKYSKVDIAVIEVGLGGRLDSTNIIKPEISIITNIGLDHTSILGDTLEKIAKEKAGIIKEVTPIIIGERSSVGQVFTEIAAKVKAPIIFCEDDYTIENQIEENNTLHVQIRNRSGEKINVAFGLTGYCQRKNLITILAAIEQLKKKGITISEEALCLGLLHVTEQTGLRGRWQKINDKPYTIIDTGHNEHAMPLLTSQLTETCKHYRESHIIWGMSSDKRPSDVLKYLPHSARYYFTQADTERASNSQELEILGIRDGLRCSSYTTVKDAIEAVKEKANADDFIFIGGSNFVVADALKEIKHTDNQW